MEAVKAVYREFIAQRFGYLHRSSVLWRETVFAEQNEEPVHLALAYQGAEVVGYLAYTLRANKVNNVAREQEIAIRDFCWLTPDAYRSLWSFLGSHDLVGRISWDNAPMDDPASQLMLEPRLLHAHDREGGKRV